MVRHSLFALPVILSTVAHAQTIVFEGRIPKGTQLSVLDKDNAYFNPSNVFGKDLSLSKILKQSTVSPSLFDKGSTPFEVTINDQSIFAPSATNVQTGFRRAELLPANNSGTDPSTTGVKALHFSVQKDTKLALNLSHEYQLVFLESKDFSTNQFVLKTGTILDHKTADPDTLTLYSNVKSAKALFSTKFTPDVFHNFGILLNFDKNITQVFYSNGTKPLAAVTKAETNDISGQGQYHFGILKKPVNAKGDITKNGDQPKGINEGVVFGGIFMEDIKGKNITLSPSKKEKKGKEPGKANGKHAAFLDTELMGH